MSIQIYPERVDWETFLKSFPKPGDWTTPCETELSWDDLTVNIQAGEIYAKLRKDLSPGTVQSLEKLFVAVCINGISKPKAIDHSSLYKPHCAFAEDDFQYGHEGYVIPRASPEQVGEILAAAESITPDALAEDIGRVWPKSERRRFRKAEEFVAYFTNWVEILREIRSNGGGLAIDMG